jgi:hemerythrin
MAIFFQWNNDLSVGNTFIDYDHRHLIDLLNNLYSAMIEGKAPDVVGTVLNDLIQYTQEHLIREEIVMHGFRYAEYAVRKEAHDNLTLKVLTLQKKFNDGETELSVELLTFLFEWLFDHIMQKDKKLVEAIQDAKLEADYQAYDMHGSFLRL